MWIYQPLGNFCHYVDAAYWDGCVTSYTHDRLINSVSLAGLMGSTMIIIEPVTSILLSSCLLGSPDSLTKVIIEYKKFRDNCVKRIWKLIVCCHTHYEYYNSHPTMHICIHSAFHYNITQALVCTFQIHPSFFRLRRRKGRGSSLIPRLSPSTLFYTCD